MHLNLIIITNPTHVDLLLQVNSMLDFVAFETIHIKKGLQKSTFKRPIHIFSYRGF